MRLCVCGRPIYAGRQSTPFSVCGRIRGGWSHRRKEGKHTGFCFLSRKNKPCTLCLEKIKFPRTTKSGRLAHLRTINGSGRDGCRINVTVPPLCCDMMSRSRHKNSARLCTLGTCIFLLGVGVLRKTSVNPAGGRRRDAATARTRFWEGPEATTAHPSPPSVRAGTNAWAQPVHDNVYM